MNPVTLRAFSDELQKIAEPARSANDAFGLPMKTPKKPRKRTDEWSDAQSAYRSHSMMAGEPSPDMSMTERVINPGHGPGGV